MGPNLKSKVTPPPLDLCKILLDKVEQELENFAQAHPVTEDTPLDYAEIDCDLKELNIGLTKIIYHYLHKKGHPSARKATAERLMITGRTVYNYINSMGK